MLCKTFLPSILNSQLYELHFFFPLLSRLRQPWRFHFLYYQNTPKCLNSTLNSHWCRLSLLKVWDLLGGLKAIPKQKLVQSWLHWWVCSMFTSFLSTMWLQRKGNLKTQPDSGQNHFVLLAWKYSSISKFLPGTDGCMSGLVPSQITTGSSAGRWDPANRIREETPERFKKGWGWGASSWFFC